MLITKAGFINITWLSPTAVESVLAFSLTKYWLTPRLATWESGTRYMYQYSVDDLYVVSTALGSLDSRKKSTIFSSKRSAFQ